MTGTAGVIGSALLGALATLAIQGLVNWIIYLRESRNGEFTGVWYGILPTSGGKDERREVMRVRQKGQVLYISIKRYYPLDERGRRWKMTAYLHGNILIGVFYTTIPKKDPSSYGAILLHRDYAVKNCTVWRGYYVRPDSNTLSDIVNMRADRFPIVWQSVKPEERSYWVSEGTQAESAGRPVGNDA
jgi:hypothetical protein